MIIQLVVSGPGGKVAEGIGEWAGAGFSAAGSWAERPYEAVHQ
jgi:hypothetical protein